jgi:hypothetical protein
LVLHNLQFHHYLILQVLLVENRKGRLYRRHHLMLLLKHQ